MDEWFVDALEVNNVMQVPMLEPFMFAYDTLFTCNRPAGSSLFGGLS